MTLREIRNGPLAEALLLLPAKMTSSQAEVMLLAIGLQESRFEHRRQIGGPARGFWQFERGGGVAGVLRHAASREHALAVCRVRNVIATEGAVYAALEHDDVLAAAFARLLLWTDPKALPALGDEQAAWDLYLRVWRPGRPRKEKWAASWSSAQQAMA